MIDRNGRVYDTKPERQFRAFATKFGLRVVQNQTISIAADNQTYSFQCDFLTPNDSGWAVDYEIDGPTHESDINHKKDLWKDFIKARTGLKVIHVPAVLCNKEWWGYLSKEIDKALKDKCRSAYIIA